MAYWDKVLEEVASRDANSKSRLTNINCATSDNKKYESKDLFKLRKPKPEISAKKSEVQFSRREADCLVQFLEGKTINETALVLGLSSRTVEFYVKNMRQKVGCCTKAELIRVVKAGDFVLLWEDD
ncbi:MAG: helix-turn-helix transcriptional regulator [Gammaproteobacteria bacterium]|nr:helix-turn-helix transcriptional regulator [Gammaproteobacteria bacterium]